MIRMQRKMNEIRHLIHNDIVGSWVRYWFLVPAAKKIREVMRGFREGKPTALIYQSTAGKLGGAQP